MSSLKRISTNFTLQDAIYRVDMLINNVKDVKIEPDSIKMQLKFDLMKAYGLLGVTAEYYYNYIHGPVSPASKIIDLEAIETAITAGIKMVKGVSYGLPNAATSKVYLPAEEYGASVKIVTDSEWKAGTRHYYIATGSKELWLLQGSDVNETSGFYINFSRYPSGDFSDLTKKVDLPDFVIDYWLTNVAVKMLQQKGAETPGFLTEERDNSLKALAEDVSRTAAMMKQQAKDQIGM